MSKAKLRVLNLKYLKVQLDRERKRVIRRNKNIKLGLDCLIFITIAISPIIIYSLI